MNKSKRLERKPKKGDIVFANVDGNLMELEVINKNTMIPLSIEFAPEKSKTCNHQNGNFPERFLGGNVVLHRCNDCFLILFHTVIEK